MKAVYLYTGCIINDKTVKEVYDHDGTVTVIFTDDSRLTYDVSDDVQTRPSRKE